MASLSAKDCKALWYSLLDLVREKDMVAAERSEALQAHSVAVQFIPGLVAVNLPCSRLSGSSLEEK